MFYDIQKNSNCTGNTANYFYEYKAIVMKIWPNFAKIKLKVLGEFGEHPRLVIFCIAYG